MSRTQLAIWSVVALILAALAVPWFLWDDASVIAGLPVWLWWHIGWMVLSTGVFTVFIQTAWGVGAETEPTANEARPTEVRS
jgi:hypothetical protein